MLGTCKAYAGCAGEKYAVLPCFIDIFAALETRREHAGVSSTIHIRKLQAFSLAIFQKFAGTARSGREKKLQDLQAILSM
jgi:hypothetical protein